MTILNTRTTRVMKLPFDKKEYLLMRIIDCAKTVRMSNIQKFINMS